MGQKVEENAGFYNLWLVRSSATLNKTTLNPLWDIQKNYKSSSSQKTIYKTHSGNSFSLAKVTFTHASSCKWKIMDNLPPVINEKTTPPLSPSLHPFPMTDTSWQPYLHCTKKTWSRFTMESLCTLGSKGHEQMHQARTGYPNDHEPTKVQLTHHVTKSHKSLL